MNEEGIHIEMRESKESAQKEDIILLGKDHDLKIESLGGTQKSVEPEKSQKEKDIEEGKYDLEKLPQIRSTAEGHQHEFVEFVCTLQDNPQAILTEGQRNNEYADLNKKYIQPIKEFLQQKEKEPPKIADARDEDILKAQHFLESKDYFLETLNYAFERAKQQVESEFQEFAFKIMQAIEKAKNQAIEEKTKQRDAVLAIFEDLQNLFNNNYFDIKKKIAQTVHSSSYEEFQKHISDLIFAPNPNDNFKISNQHRNIKLQVEQLEDAVFSKRLKAMTIPILKQIKQYMENLLTSNLDLNRDQGFGWTAENVENIRSIRSDAPILAICNTEDGFIATGHGFPNYNINVWSLDDYKVTKTLRGHEKSVTSLIYFQRSKTLVSGACDNLIKLWDLEKFTIKYTHKMHLGFIFALTIISPEEGTFASGSHDKTIKIWSCDKKGVTKTLYGHSEVVWSLVLLQDKETLASGGGDGKIKLWNVSAGECFRTIKAHKDQINCLATYESSKLISGGDDSWIRIWNWEVGDQPLLTIKEIKCPIWGMQLMQADNQKSLVILGDETTVYIYDLEEQRVVNHLKGFEGLVKSTLETPDGWLLTGDYDKRLRFWNALKID